MVKNAKAKGTEFEHQCIKLLHKHGFPIVVRSAGSLGALDLLAVHNTGYSWAVTCKYLRKYSRKSEELDIIDLAKKAFNCKAILMYRIKPRGKIAIDQLFETRRQ